MPVSLKAFEEVNSEQRYITTCLDDLEFCFNIQDMHVRVVFLHSFELANTFCIMQKLHFNWTLTIALLLNKVYA